MSTTTTTGKMTTAEALAELDAYCRKHGKTRANAAPGVRRWREAYLQDKADKQKAATYSKPEARVKAEAEVIVNEWQIEKNKEIAEANAKLTYGVGQPPLEIGKNISFESAYEQAKLWWAEKEQAYDDHVTASARAFQDYGRAEEQRAGRILTMPYPKNGIGRKFLDRYDVVVITEAMAEHYVKYYVDNEGENLKDLQRTQVAIAANNLGTTFTPDEAARIEAFVVANQLDFVAPSYEAAFQILCAESVIRREPVAWSGPTVPEPKLPEVVERPVEPYRPLSRAAETAQREADLIADIRGTFGDYLDEVNAKQAVPVADVILRHAYDAMRASPRATVDRQSVRKNLFYSALAFGQRLEGFSDDEIDSFNDQVEMHQVSAEETKRQLARYGNVSLSRVPNPQTAMLEQIVKNTARKN